MNLGPEEPVAVALGWHDGGAGVALATVLKTWGSSPRPVGSQLAIRADGMFSGSVSGGCVERAVIEAGQAAIGTGRPQLLEFSVADADAWAVGLACGGRIQVLVAPWTAGSAETWRQASDAVAAGDVVGLATDLDTGAVSRVPAPAWPVLDQSAFTVPLAPPPRLLVVGAVHIAQALLPMARLAGWKVALIDPRAGFADPARFPDTEIHLEWPDAALARLAPDARTAIVTLTHDPKLDEPALRAALASPALYVGALGSRRTHEKRVARLREHGLDAGQLERIHAPIGLSIGAATPAEIAVSILAEIVQTLRARTTAPQVQV